MATVVTKTVGNLFKILYSNNTSFEDKTDSLLSLFTHYQKDKDDTVTVLVKESERFYKILQGFLKENNKALMEAVLSVLGQHFSNTKIVRIISTDNQDSLMSSIIDQLESKQDKSVYIRCFWCLGHQNLSSEVIAPIVPRVLKVFGKFVEDVDQKSETVLNEGLKTIKRLCEQCPDQMQESVESWFKYIIHLSISDVPKNREVSLDIIEISIEFLLLCRGCVKSFLLEQLNTKDLSKTLTNYFHEDVCPVHVLNVWSFILRLLGEGFFEMDRTNVTNPLLKIAEKAFSSKSSEISLALNNLWRSLIDVVFVRPDEFERKMEKIFLLPLKIRYRNEIIANESLKTNWHLVCKINKKMNSYFEKVIIPVLDKHLTSPEIQALNLPGNSNTSLTTPDKISKRKSLSRSPKSPHQPSHSTKLYAIEMLTQLLAEDQERIKVNNKLELFTGPALNHQNILKHHEKILSYVMNAAECCNIQNETKLNHLYVSLMVSFRSLPMNQDKKMVWEKVIHHIGRLTSQAVISLPSILKILLLIPEEVLHWSFTDLASDLNKDGNVWLYTMELLLHKNILGSDGHDHERLFILYERMIGVIFSGLTNHLRFTGLVFTLLEKTNSFFKLQDIRWRLWSTLTCLLSGYITKTNNVSEDDNNLEYNFSTVLKSLTYPLTDIDISKLQEGTLKELMKVWEEMFLAYSRAVNLMTGVDLNVATEEFFRNMLQKIKNIEDKDFLTDPTSYPMYLLLLKMANVAIQTFDFTDLRQLYSGPMTPSKVAKKLSKPLGNFKSYVGLVKFCFENFTELVFKDSKGTEQLMFDLTNLLESYYSGLVSHIVLNESTRVLVKPIATIMNNKDKCSGKLMTRIEKLIIAIFTSYERNKNVIFNDEVMTLMEDVLIHSLKSERRVLIKRTISFWNATFGKVTNLHYTEQLKDTLQNCKTKTVILMPGLKSGNTLQNTLFIDSQDDTAQFPDFSKSPKLKTQGSLAASPIKIHGSFLHTGVKGEVKPSLDLFRSPGKVSKSPGGNTPNKSTRRKLPLNINEASCDFVEIKDSPKNKKRLLTDRQKEKMRERKSIPVMYNNLDQQSQDTTLFNGLSQDVTMNDITLDAPEKNMKANDKVEMEASQSLLPNGEDLLDIAEKTDNTKDTEGVEITTNIAEVSDKDIIEADAIIIINDEPTNENTSSIPNDDVHIIEETEDLDITASKNCASDHPGKEALSPDVVPSSQTQEQVDSPLSRSGLSLTSQLRNSIHELAKRTAKEGINEEMKCSVVADDQKNPDDDGKESAMENVKTGESSPEVPPLFFNDCEKHVNEKITGESEDSENSPMDRLMGEPMIIVKKLSSDETKVASEPPLRNKRKRGNVLKNVNQNKRRKSDGAILKSTTLTKKRENASASKDPFDFSQNQPEKQRESPVSRRTRRSGRPIKHRHSVGGKLANSVEETTKDDSKTKSKPDGEKEKVVVENEKLLVKNEKVVVENEKNVVENEKVVVEKDIPDIKKTIRTDVNTSHKTETLPLQQNSLITKVEVSKSVGLSTTAATLITSTALSAVTSTSSCLSSVIQDTIPSISSPSLKYAKNQHKSIMLGSPSRKIFKADSLPASPVNGILKKRINGCIESPSPPNKRRVSFQLPEGTVLLHSDANDSLAKPITATDENANKYTVVRNKPKVEEKKKNIIPFCPELVTCNAPIEKILPSITLSRGMSHVVRAQNIRTVGDLCALSEKQVENLPIRSPKVKTVRNALRTFSSQQVIRDTKPPLPKSPLVIAQPKDSSMMDSTTPTKDEALVKEAALLATPSRHNEIVKPTSLFIDGKAVDKISDDLVLEESFTVVSKDDSLMEGISPNDSDIVFEKNLDSVENDLNTSVDHIDSSVVITGDVAPIVRDEGDSEETKSETNDEAMSVDVVESKIRIDNKDVTDNKVVTDNQDVTNNKDVTEKENVIEDRDVVGAKIVNKNEDIDKHDDVTKQGDNVEQNNASETNVTEMLHNIDFTTLSTSTIFDVVSELDKLKVIAMAELKTRMMK